MKVRIRRLGLGLGLVLVGYDFTIANTEVCKVYFQEMAVKTKLCLIGVAWTATVSRCVRLCSGSALFVGGRTHTSPNCGNQIKFAHEHLHVSPWQPGHHKMKLRMCIQ